MLLPEADSLLLGPDRVPHVDLHEVHLAAWRPLGDLSAGVAFQDRQLPIFVQLMDRQPAICTTPSDSPFLVGVLEVARIPFTLLSFFSYLQHL